MPGGPAVAEQSLGAPLPDAVAAAVGQLAGTRHVGPFESS
jgi:hypothetical protein